VWVNCFPMKAYLDETRFSCRMHDTFGHSQDQS
jgi:hypothetical protein